MNPRLPNWTRELANQLRSSDDAALLVVDESGELFDVQDLVDENIKSTIRRCPEYSQAWYLLPPDVRRKDLALTLIESRRCSPMAAATVLPPQLQQELQ